MEASPILSSESSPLPASSSTSSPTPRDFYSDSYSESENDKSGAKALYTAQQSVLDDFENDKEDDDLPFAQYLAAIAAVRRLTCQRAQSL